MTDYIRVSFAINDDYGEWNYNIRRVDFGGLCDANPYDIEAQAVAHEGHLYIGYLKIKYHHRQSWYGNMSFEAFTLKAVDAQKLAEYLRSRYYRPEEGRPDIYDAWHNDQPITFVQYYTE